MRFLCFQNGSPLSLDQQLRGIEELQVLLSIRDLYTTFKCLFEYPHVPIILQPSYSRKDKISYEQTRLSRCVYNVHHCLCGRSSLYLLHIWDSYWIVWECWWKPKLHRLTEKTIWKTRWFVWKRTKLLRNGLYVVATPHASWIAY